MKYATVLMLVLAGWAALTPNPVSWVFIAAVAVFEVWLLASMRKVDRRPVPVAPAPRRRACSRASAWPAASVVRRSPP